MPKANCSIQLFHLSDKQYKEATGKTLLVHWLRVISPTGTRVDIVEPWSNLPLDLMTEIDETYILKAIIPGEAVEIELSYSQMQTIAIAQQKSPD